MVVFFRLFVNAVLFIIMLHTQFTDTHTHLASFLQQQDASHSGLLGVLKRAQQNGVHRLITIGTGVEDWETNKQLSLTFTDHVQIYYTVGLHPCEVSPDWKHHIQILKTHIEEMKHSQQMIGLGEIGLDGFHLPTDAHQRSIIEQRQLQAFQAQLELAKCHDLRVVIHSRERFKSCLELIDASGIPGERFVFHCFSEGPNEIDALLDRGIKASFTGTLTYKNAANTRLALLRQGLERLMLETDAPYLTPVPLRGKINEPSYLIHTAEACAGLFGVALKQVSACTQAAVEAFWGI